MPRAYQLDRQSIFAGETGIKRTKKLLHLLGDPHEKIKVIHVAGTSGKGSTCFLISQLLKSQGFNIGLYQKPHLVDVRERFQLNNEMISQEEFVEFVKDVKPAVESVRNQPDGLSWYEAIVSLAYYIFWRKGVDYAVIETGLGGLLDASNVVENANKLAVLTTIGYDHVDVLGDTLPKIASQKAGIIKPKIMAITLKQSSEIIHEFQKQATKVGADLLILDKDRIVRNILYNPNNSRFDFHYKNVELKQVRLNLKGKFQIENCALALSVLCELSLRDTFVINKLSVEKTLSTVEFRGHYEVFIIKGKEVVLDSAHNPQKMQAFLESLDYNKKYNFVLAFKKSKDYVEMLRLVIRYTHHIYLTDFSISHQDFIHSSEDPDILLKEVKAMGFNSASTITNSKKSWSALIEKTEHPLVFTGSMYLLSSTYLDLKKI